MFRLSHASIVKIQCSSIGLTLYIRDELYRFNNVRLYLSYDPKTILESSLPMGRDGMLREFGSFHIGDL